MIDIDKIEALAKAAPSGQWEVWTSNSWRRVYANQGREQVRVIEPAVSHDRWPDLMFGEGVREYLEGVTPDAILELIAEVRSLREAAQGVLNWTEVGHRPPVPEQIPSGEMARVRVHALVRLHQTMHGELPEEKS